MKKVCILNILLIFVAANLLLGNNVIWVDDCTEVQYSNLAPKINLQGLVLKNVFGKGEMLSHSHRESHITDEDARHMHWIERGSIEDIVPNVVTYTTLNNQKATEIIGIKNNVEINLSGNRRLFITDDEQQVLPFWWKMRIEGIIDDGSNFLHIDAHLDTLIVQKTNNPIPNAASVREVYELSFTAQESGFLIPALATRMIDENAIYLMDPRLDWFASKLKVQRIEGSASIKDVRVSDDRIDTKSVTFSLVSVDLDSLAGLSRKEAHQYLRDIAALCRNAKAVTICTSPTYMLDQEAAMEYAVFLATLLLRPIHSFENGEVITSKSPPVPKDPRIEQAI